MNNTTIDIDNLEDGENLNIYIQGRLNNLFNKYFEKCIEILDKKQFKIQVLIKMKLKILFLQLIHLKFQKLKIGFKFFLEMMK